MEKDRKWSIHIDSSEKSDRICISTQHADPFDIMTSIYELIEILEVNYKMNPKIVFHAIEGAYFLNRKLKENLKAREVNIDVN